MRARRRARAVTAVLAAIIAPLLYATAVGATTEETCKPKVEEEGLVRCSLCEIVWRVAAKHILMQLGRCRQLSDAKLVFFAG